MADLVKGKRAGRLWDAMTTVLLGAMILFYLVVIFIINLSVTPEFYITDMYADIMVAVEMWKAKSLFPADWVFGNQLYCFSTPVLAAVIYGITGNPFRSMGAASFLIALMVLSSFEWMLRAGFPRFRDRLLGMAALIALPVLFGDAVLAENGWQLMFTMCSYYACYMVTAFLAFGCYLRSRRVFPGKMLVLTCLMCFAMGIQSLRQTAVMLPPVFAMEMLAIAGRARKKEKLFTGTSRTAVWITISNLAGLAAGRVIPVNQHTIFGAVSLENPARYIGNLGDSLKRAASLFFRNTTTADSLYLLILSAVVLAALVSVFVFRREEAVWLLAMEALSVLAIVGIDVVTTMQIRGIYYFMLYPLIASLVVFLFSRGGCFRRAAVLLLMCVVFFVTVWNEVSPVMVQVKDRKLDVSCQINRELKSMGVTTVYSYWNGCERIVAADHGKMKAGFWNHRDNPFVPVTYLCNPAIYDVPAETAAYVFYSREEAEAGIRKAGQAGISMTQLCAYPEADIHIFTAPENLMTYFAP